VGMNGYVIQLLEYDRISTSLQDFGPSMYFGHVQLYLKVA